MPAETPPSLLARLRAETRPYHDALERNPFNQALLRADVTAPVVQQFLAKLYGFLVPYEARVAAHAFGPEWQIEARRRAPLLRADLGAAVADALPLCSALPPLATEAQLLGAMYVLEGSTLGGQVIGRTLTQAGLPASRYFTGAGSNTGPLWQSFGRALTHAVTTPADHAAVITSASATFRALTEWINPA